LRKLRNTCIFFELGGKWERTIRQTTTGSQSKCWPVINWSV